MIALSGIALLEPCAGLLAVRVFVPCGLFLVVSSARLFVVPGYAPVTGAVDGRPLPCAGRAIS